MDEWQGDEMVKMGLCKINDKAQPCKYVHTIL